MEKPDLLPIFFLGVMGSRNPMSPKKRKAVLSCQVKASFFPGGTRVKHVSLSRESASPFTALARGSLFKVGCQEFREMQARKDEMRAQDQRRTDLMAQKQEAFQETLHTAMRRGDAGIQLEKNEIRTTWL